MPAPALYSEAFNAGTFEMGTREPSPIAQLDLDIGSFADRSVDSQGLNCLSRKLSTFNVVIFH
jgi:hypothetical protein